MDNRMSLYKLEVLLLVVDERSVTAAARRLHVSQPVVTGHLRGLERQFGAQLFTRVGRGLEPTPAGHIAIGLARDVLARAREAQRDLDTLFAETARTVAVASTTAVAGNVLPDVVVTFRESRPDTVIRVRSMDVDEVVAAVRSGESDVGLASYLDPDDAAGLDVEWLGDEDIVLITSPDEPRDSVGLAELGGLPFVCTPGGSARRRSLDQQLAAFGVPQRRVVVEMSEREGILDAVRRGAGGLHGEVAGVA
ncbi:LysR family transcriptional regulator, partial [Pseudonocardia pini]|uniref:LysR family transcriptional regulator n=1 Tax=Pseudonocardia pini TaxID=2758030 RepID=UPI0015F065A2